MNVQSNRHKFTATLGLVVHAAGIVAAMHAHNDFSQRNVHSCSLAADGVALGAAASTSQMHVEMIVFIAIMLHKVNAVAALIDKKFSAFDNMRSCIHISILIICFVGACCVWPGFVFDARRSRPNADSKTFDDIFCSSSPPRTHHVF